MQYTILHVLILIAGVYNNRSKDIRMISHSMQLRQLRNRICNTQCLIICIALKKREKTRNITTSLVDRTIFQDPQSREEMCFWKRGELCFREMEFEGTSGNKINCASENKVTSSLCVFFKIQKCNTGRNMFNNIFIVIIMKHILFHSFICMHKYIFIFFSKTKSLGLTP